MADPSTPASGSSSVASVGAGADSGFGLVGKTVFRPFVGAGEDRPELTVRALVLGAVFGVLFGAVTVYVGLRAGLTVAASIPISVLSISILRAFGRASHS